VVVAGRATTLIDRCTVLGGNNSSGEEQTSDRGYGAGTEMSHIGLNFITLLNCNRDRSGSADASDRNRYRYVAGGRVGWYDRVDLQHACR